MYKLKTKIPTYRIGYTWDNWLNLDTHFTEYIWQDFYISNVICAAMFERNTKTFETKWIWFLDKLIDMTNYFHIDLKGTWIRLKTTYISSLLSKRNQMHYFM